MSEINDIIELLEGIYFLYITYQYQQKDPILLAKYKNRTYKTGSYRGGSNMYFNFITCEDITYFASLLQSYVLD